MFNLIGFFVSLYKFFLHILSHSLKWLQQKCNVHHSKTLQPLSNFFKLINTKLYINLLFLSHVFLTNLSCFCRLFIIWFSSSTHLKVDLSILDMYFCVFYKNKFIYFPLILSVFKSFECFWICRFFRSWFGYAGFSDMEDVQDD